MICTELFGEALARGRHFGHDDHAGFAGFQTLYNGEADGTATEHEDVVAWLEGTCRDGVPGYQEGFHEGWISCLSVSLPGVEFC